MHEGGERQQYFPLAAAERFRRRRAVDRRPSLVQKSSSHRELVCRLGNVTLTTLHIEYVSLTTHPCSARPTTTSRYKSNSTISPRCPSMCSPAAPSHLMVSGFVVCSLIRRPSHSTSRRSLDPPTVIHPAYGIP